MVSGSKILSIRSGRRAFPASHIVSDATRGDGVCESIDASCPRRFHPKRLHDFLAEHFVFYEVSQGSGDSSVGDDSVDPEKTLEQRRSRAARNSKKFGTLLRSKGWFWIGNRPIGIGEWSQAGVIGRLGCNAQWRITAPEE